MSDPSAKRPDGMPVGKPFPPGNNANPKGRPSIKRLRRKLKELEPAALEALKKDLEGGSSPERSKAIALVLAYRYGKPVDQLALLDKHDEAQSLSALTDEQLEARLKAITAKATEGAAEPAE